MWGKQGRKRLPPFEIDDPHLREAILHQVDPDWYRSRYHDVATSGVDPFEHFLTDGLAAGLLPNEFFDPDWYLKQYRDVAAAQMNPIIHYIQYGWTEGRNPGPKFNSRDYIASHPELESGDEEPLAHLIRERRQRRGVGSHGVPDQAGSNGADRRTEGDVPRTGDGESRAALDSSSSKPADQSGADDGVARPDAPPAAGRSGRDHDVSDQRTAQVARTGEAERTGPDHALPDQRAADVVGQAGHSNGLLKVHSTMPIPLASSQTEIQLVRLTWVYALYDCIFDRMPDAGGLGGLVKALETDHSPEQIAEYLFSSKEFIDRDGKSPGTKRKKEIWARVASTQAGAFQSIVDLVDVEWYRSRHADLVEARLEPVQHYLTAGIWNNVAPNEFFDPIWYLSEHADIAKAGCHPAIHYVVRGWREGRSSHPHFNAQAFIAARPDARARGRDPLPIFLERDRASPEVALQMGNALRQQGKPDAAIRAYRRSFEAKPSRGAFFALRELNEKVDLPAGKAARDESLWLEIGDLLVVMNTQSVVSGIQRVQFGIVSYILSQAPANGKSRGKFVTWREDVLWQISEDALRDLVEHYKNERGGQFDRQRQLISNAMDNAVFVDPREGDTFVSTGVVYLSGDLSRARGKLRSLGVRIGLIVYDFIPLCYPEFCHPDLIESFSHAMAEALLQIDFAITISDYVAAETKRLMQASGYPPIPVRAVPLARTSEGPTPFSKDERWPASIADLRAEDFVLCVSSINAHKNHMFLINLWRLLSSEGRDVPKLVIVGRRAFGVDDVFNQLMSSQNFAGRVVIIDGPTDRELETLYQNCLFTICPSFVEGWGLPVGESLARGKLSLASKATSIREVGGDLALYFDPYNVREAEAIARRLFDDRKQLRKLEAKIRSDFKERTWNEYSADFLQAVADMAGGKQAGGQDGRGPRILLGQQLGIRRAPDRWRFGTNLPPLARISEIVLPRIILAEGWGPLGDLGSAMAAAKARLALPICVPPATHVRIVLRLEATDGPRCAPLVVTSADGARVTAAASFDGRRDLLVSLDTVVDTASHASVLLTCETAGAYRLEAVLCLPHDNKDDAPAPMTTVRPTALIAQHASAVSACSREAIELALKRRGMLRSGWAEPEAWGTWMAAPEAVIAFDAQHAKSKLVQVILRLRVSPWARDMTLEVTSSGGNKTLRIDHRYADSCIVVVDCKADDRFRVGLTLAVSGGSSDARVPYLGLASLIFGSSATEADRLRLAEQLFLDSDCGVGGSDEAIIRTQLRYNILGHANGSYSLANVNRRLALSLEALRPDAVRLSQIEVRPTRDLSLVPNHERARIEDLARRQVDGGGMEVSISQHWPIWEPLEPRGLSLAYIFWEESKLPQDIVDTLNRSFAAVLAPSQFVAKSLRDSGVRKPIRTIGFSPDLEEFLDVGARRKDRGHGATDEPFVFLHVSSCFPRKGVDVLLRAYAHAFSCDDRVELVIKTFPNPHNDVEQQLASLRHTHPRLAPVRIVNCELGLQEMSRLYETADAMVLPARGEGFNIPAAEALAAGLSLIVTGFGAHLDFVDSSYARLVDYEFARSRSHVRSAGSIWVDPDVDDLKAAMRETWKAHLADDLSALRHRRQSGRAAAESVANSGLWAQWIETSALGLLGAASSRAPSPKIAWISSWNVRCGIAQYSHYFLDAFPDAARDVVVLCDDRPSIASSVGRNAPLAKICWRAPDPASIEPLAAEIEATGALVVVIQHHKSLITWRDLTRLLRHPHVSKRCVVIMLHNVTEILRDDDPDHDALIAALASVSRVLVHAVHDLNTLKAHGLVANVALFPHGVDARSTFVAKDPRTLAPQSTPLIGAYGYMLPHKGFLSLIRAMEPLRRSWPNARLRMVTAEYPIHFSAEALQACREAANELGLGEAIEWHTDYLPMERSLALLNECDLVVLPYQETPESASGAVRSALAAEVTIMVTPIQIFDDLDDAVLRFHGVDVQSIAQGVGWALERPDVRRDFVHRSLLWRQANDWHVLAKRLHGMIVGMTLES